MIRKAIGEFEAIAGFIARQTQAARDFIARRGKPGFGVDAAIGIQHLERDTIGLEDGDILGGAVDLFLGAEKLQRALGAFVIGNAGFGPQIDQAIAAVFGKADHAAFVDGIAARIAVAQHAGDPFDLGQRRARTDDQRRMFHEQPFHRLDRNAGGRPRRGIAWRHLACVGKAGFQRRGGLAVDHRHLMPGFGQIPRRSDANDARPKNNDFHADDPFGAWPYGRWIEMIR